MTTNYIRFLFFVIPLMFVLGIYFISVNSVGVYAKEPEEIAEDFWVERSDLVCEPTFRFSDYATSIGGWLEAEEDDTIVHFEIGDKKGGIVSEPTICSDVCNTYFWVADESGNKYVSAKTPVKIGIHDKNSEVKMTYAQFKDFLAATWPKNDLSKNELYRSFLQ